MSVLERVFKLGEAGTSVNRELRGGLTTFFAMCYIIFVQPVFLSAAGMPGSAVMVATCLSAAAATLMMAFTANYPVALAPAMGHNAFFAFIVCGATAQGGMGYTWQQALAANLLAGLAFLVLALFGFREKLLNAVPTCLKHGIAVGIGLLIGRVGLGWSGLIVDSPAAPFGLGDPGSPVLLVFFAGLAVMGALTALRVPAALLIGLMAATGVGMLLGVVPLVSLNMFGSEAHWLEWWRPLGETVFAFDFGGLLDQGFGALLAVVFVFFFLDLFDTIGTLIGVADQAGLLDEQGHLPRARGAMVADASGTVIGACLGTSTVTCYIESAAGVQAGARTGLANLITGGLLLISVLLWPLVSVVAAEVQVAPGVFIHPVIAPVLLLVGALMIRGVRKIDWKRGGEAIPAFVALATMPAMFSITEGIAAGFIAFSLIKLVTRRLGEAHWMIHAFSLLFVVRYALLGAGLIKG